MASGDPAGVMFLRGKEFSRCALSVRRRCRRANGDRACASRNISKLSQRSTRFLPRPLLCLPYLTVLCAMYLVVLLLRFAYRVARYSFADGLRHRNRLAYMLYTTRKYHTYTYIYVHDVERQRQSRRWLVLSKQGHNSTQRPVTKPRATQSASSLFLSLSVASVPLASRKPRGALGHDSNSGSVRLRADASFACARAPPAFLACIHTLGVPLARTYKPYCHARIITRDACTPAVSLLS